MNYTIKELIKTEYDTIQAEETVKDAIAMFSKKERPRTLLVFDKENKYIGVVTERLIVRSGNQSEKTKIKHLFTKAPKINNNTTIFEAAKLMLSSNMKHLPVFDGDTILGIVTASDLLVDSLNKTTIGEVSVRRFMTTSPRIVQFDEKISSVMSIFNESSVSRVPILRDGKINGIVTKHDVVTKLLISNDTINLSNFANDKNNVLNNNIESIMSTNLISLNPNALTSNAIKLISENEINSLLIIDENDRLNGILTKKDLLEPLATINNDKNSQKRFIQIRGDTANIENHIKEEISYVFDQLLKKHESNIGEAHAFIYVKQHKGRLNKGKFRGVEMYYIRARISTDIGTFVASTEEFGSLQTANEVSRLLNKQILTFFDKLRDKNKNRIAKESFGIKAAI